MSTTHLISISTLIREIGRPYGWIERWLNELAILPALQVDATRYYAAEVIDRIAEAARQEKITQLQAESEAAAVIKAPQLPGRRIGRLNRVHRSPNQ